MGIEIERKFLVDCEKWKQADRSDSKFYRQGYLVHDGKKTVRVRVSNDAGFITIKGETRGLSRTEYEYAIPLEDAIELLDNFAGSIIEKTRFRVPFAGRVWEVDEFSGDNEGLMVAEIELERETEKVDLPPWITEEVTGLEQYYNSCLSMHPFKAWKDASATTHDK